MTPVYIEITECGTKYYYKDKAMTSFHREDGPAVEYPNGYRAWYLNNDLHREDGPAVEHADGDKQWYLNGQLHREDGPAIEYFDGSKSWYINSKRHREDGPAVEWLDGDKEWWLEGREYTEEDFKKRTAKEVVLTMGEIAERLGVDVGKLKIAK
jgi:hypothetical protein